MFQMMDPRNQGINSKRLSDIAENPRETMEQSSDNDDQFIDRQYDHNNNIYYNPNNTQVTSPYTDHETKNIKAREDLKRGQIRASKTNEELKETTQQINALCDDDDEKSDIINSLDKSGWGAIHYACNFGYLDIVGSLQEQESLDVNKETDDEDGWTPLMISINRNHQESIKFFN